jgi:Putative prokaryotic signal transducing protein
VFVSEYVTIERADNQAIAELIKQRLDEAGIPCLLVASGMAAVAGPGASHAVTVPAERADEARALLRD